VLGKRCSKDSAGQDINLSTVWHKCLCCRVPQSLFEGFVGPGSYGISYVALAMWNAVQGVSLTDTLVQLNISEGTGVAFYKRAYAIMACQAHHLQEAIVWGSESSLTVEVEIDASVFARWRVTDEATGSRTYYYYCYLGARQRGDTGKLALIPLGISKSENEGRVNPESEPAYHTFCRRIFGKESKDLISMTDGAGAYRCRREECRHWFLEHHWVNNSSKQLPELSRSQLVLDDAETRSLRNAMAGTMTLDAEWGFLKAGLPKNKSSKGVMAQERLDLLIRVQQFYRMTSTGDRWASYAKELDDGSEGKLQGFVSLCQLQMPRLCLQMQFQTMRMRAWVRQLQMCLRRMMMTWTDLI
jgi:hypothetical protein